MRLSVFVSRKTNPTTEVVDQAFVRMWYWSHARWCERSTRLPSPPLWPVFGVCARALPWYRQGLQLIAEIEHHRVLRVCQQVYTSLLSVKCAGSTSKYISTDDRSVCAVQSTTCRANRHSVGRHTNLFMSYRSSMVQSIRHDIISRRVTPTEEACRTLVTTRVDYFVSDLFCFNWNATHPTSLFWLFFISCFADAVPKYRNDHSVLQPETRDMSAASFGQFKTGL